MLPAPESWRYAQLPGIEILSNAPDRVTRRLMRDFAQFRMALTVVWPVPQPREDRVQLILCGRRGKFDAFVPANAKGPAELARASLLLRSPRQTSIVVDCQSSVLDVLATVTDEPESGIDSSSLHVDHARQLNREYLRYLLSRAEPRLPAWFEEGFTQLVMAMRVDDDEIAVGKLEDPRAMQPDAFARLQLITMETQATNGSIGVLYPSNVRGAATVDPLSGPTRPGDKFPGAPGEDRDFNAALARQPLMPMGEFLAVRRESALALNPLGSNRWAKQAYAFVHMGLYGEKNRWQKPFLQFLVRSTREPVSEGLFQECFGMSYQAMAMELRGYILWSSYRAPAYRLTSGPLPKTPPLVLRDATLAEIARIKGAALRTAGHAAAADNELVAAYIRGERNAALLTALGVMEYDAGRWNRAEKFLAVALAGRAEDPSAYLTLAKLRLRAATEASKDSGGRLTAEQVAGIVPLLLAARTKTSAGPEAYELLAQTWAEASVKPTRADLDPIMEGAQLYPGRMTLIYTAAVLSTDAGLADLAHPLVEHGMTHAKNATVRNAFADLQATLRRSTAPTAGKG